MSKLTDPHHWQSDVTPGGGVVGRFGLTVAPPIDYAAADFGGVFRARAEQFGAESLSARIAAALDADSLAAMRSLMRKYDLHHSFPLDLIDMQPAAKLRMKVQMIRKP